MQEYDEFMDDHMEMTTDSVEDNSEQLLEEDEVSSREEAFLKGYDDASECDYTDDDEDKF